MRNFKEWMNRPVFRYEPEDLKPEVYQKILTIRKDSRFEEFGDDQLEMMMHHHTVEEILKHGPDKCMERYNDFAISDEMDLGSDPLGLGGERDDDFDPDDMSGLFGHKF